MSDPRRPADTLKEGDGDISPLPRGPRKPEKLQYPESITLPAQRRPALDAKLTEYKVRLTTEGASPDFDYTKPPKSTETMSGDNVLELQLRIVILERLLSDENVVTDELYEELSEKTKYRIHPDIFEHACKIINDYCLTGGKNLRDGTGLN